MADETALLYAIAAEPDADGPRQVYADWLDERGRGEDAERIRLGLAAAADPEDHELAQAALDACADDGVVERLAAHSGDDWPPRATYHRGLVHALSWAPGRLGAAELATLLECAPALRSLTLGLNAPTPAGLSRLCEELEALRRLELDNILLDPEDVRALQGMAELALSVEGLAQGELIALPELVHDGLESLELMQVPRSLEGQRLVEIPPEVRHLRLEQLQSVRTRLPRHRKGRPRWPRLRSLELDWTWLSEDGWRSLPRSLERLAISCEPGTIGTLPELPALRWLEVQHEQQPLLLRWALELPGLEHVGLDDYVEHDGELSLVDYARLGRFDSISWTAPPEAALQAFFEAEPRCRALELQLLGDVDLASLARCKRLESLTVHCTPLPGQSHSLPQPVLDALPHLPALSHLWLSLLDECEAADVGFPSPCRQLRRLDLTNPWPALVAACAEAMPALEVVRLRSPFATSWLTAQPVTRELAGALPAGVRLVVEGITRERRRELERAAPGVRIVHSLPGRRLLDRRD